MSKCDVPECTEKPTYRWNLLLRVRGVHMVWDSCRGHESQIRKERVLPSVAMLDADDVRIEDVCLQLTTPGTGLEWEQRYRW